MTCDLTGGYAPLCLVKLLRKSYRVTAVKACTASS